MQPKKMQRLGDLCTRAADAMRGIVTDILAAAGIKSPAVARRSNAGEESFFANQTKQGEVLRILFLGIDFSFFL